MRLLTFSSRTAKEILRDPLNLGFGLGFPTVLLLLMSAIQANIPVELFVIQKLAPGIVVFGLSFMTLFSATLIARDRESALLSRLYTTPLTAVDYILGYTLPMLPIALAQSMICYLLAWPLGLIPNVNTFFAILSVIPISILFIDLGLVCGSLLNVKQVGGLCGALLTNLTAWLSGIWFDLDLVGGVFKTIAESLPFLHAVNIERSMIAVNYQEILPDMLWIVGYDILLSVLAVTAFLYQRKHNAR